MALTRVQAPPPSIDVPPFVRRLDPGTMYKGIVLAQTVFGCYTHWNLKAECTLPCLADRGEHGVILDASECDQCRLQMPAKWKGYLHVYSTTFKREEFLEMTWRCWSEALHLVGPVASLRGYDLVASKGNGKKTQTKVELASPPPFSKERRLPNERTPELSIRHTMKL